MYLKVLTTRAQQIITDSEFSRDRIMSDLRVSPQKIEVIEPALDHHWGAQIAAARKAVQQDRVALVIGRLARHKNVERLVRAFAVTDFARTGGVLRVVGGSDVEIKRISALTRSLSLEHAVDLVGYCSQDELDRHFVTTSFLICPSLEEGYGLPAREALCAGIPVCLSTAGALRSLASLAVATFDPMDEKGMAQAIDIVARHCPDHTTLPPLFPNESNYSSAVTVTIGRALRVK